MALVVGVRFKPAGKLYYFDNSGLDLKLGDAVIVETTRGVERGIVAIDTRDVSEDQLVLPLKRSFAKLPRKTRPRTVRIRPKRLRLWNLQRKGKGHNLPMRLIDVEYTFDMGKIIFYFTAESRVDFRELVKTWPLYSVPASN